MHCAQVRIIAKQLSQLDASPKQKKKTQTIHVQMFIAIFDKFLRAVIVGAILIDQKDWRRVVMHSRRASRRDVTF